VAAAAAVGIGNAVSEMSNADEEAEKKPKTGAIDEVCSTCPPPEKEDNEEQQGKDAKRMSPKELDKAAKNNGFRDAHELKNEYQLNSKSDIFVDREGNLYAGPRKGVGTPQRLGINKNGYGF
uniref:polymorphic toxin type 33 domain-containing protein n=1 Tax=Rhizobium sp. FKY42 TaxID=2562310 RepID=UPI00197E46C8